MYAELECKTNFSFLRGASHPSEIVERALELGLPAIAITDHDGVYAIPKAWWKAKETPLKLITGASLRIGESSLSGGEDSRLTFLAQNRIGYGLLCRMISSAHNGISLENPGSSQAPRKEKGKACLSWEQLETFLAEPSASGLFAFAPLQMNFHRLSPLFRERRLFLALHRVLDGHDHSRTSKALWLRARFQVPLLATNDVHYHAPTRKPLQDALTSIREGEPLQKLGYQLFPNSERHLKSPAQMRDLFKDLPEAIAASEEIASQCTFSPSELRYRYPSEWIPGNHTPQSWLESLTREGAQRRYPYGIPELIERNLKEEFSLIAELEYADYFLTIQDIVEFARRKDILCQGRGAAANSTVCYCLGITAVDPTKVNLLFSRFLSRERQEPPDIDIDFEHERREEVLQYVYERYGRHRAAMVSAVVTYRARSSLREMAKALGLDVGILSAKKVQKHFAELASQSETKNAAELVSSLSEEMEGFPRHLSIHSGGFTLSADPIHEIVPIEPARMPGRTIIQWDKYDLDFLGLLKVDLLSLGMLSALHRTLRMIGKELHQIPHEDSATYAMIQKADTVGTFQIESRAQMNMLGRLQPKTFYDLVIEVAIVRPGPIVGGMVHPYLRRRRGIESAKSPHPILERILHRTLGVPLFQEQVMRIAIELGGFSPGAADELRRAIGAWRASGEFDRMTKPLRERFIASGLSAEYTEQILNQMKGFAEYGFPESHAASFALLAYASSYLKCHHHAEFTCGLLNSLPMGFYASHTLVDDAKLHGVIVEPVDPEESEWECRISSPNTIRLGWNMVKGIRQSDAMRLISSRPYPNLSDFLKRTLLRRDTLLRLAMGGAFSRFGLAPRAALWEILEFHRSRHRSQGDLFLDTEYRKNQLGLAHFSMLDEFQSIQEEYNAYSLSTTGHPMMALRKMQRLPKLHTKSAKELKNGSACALAGLILIRQRPPTANNMTFSTLEDEFGFLDLAIMPNVYARVKDIFLNHCFVEVRGKLQRDANSFSLLVKEMRPILKEEETLEIPPAQYFHHY